MFLILFLNNNCWFFHNSKVYFVKMFKKKNCHLIISVNSTKDFSIPNQILNQFF